MVGQEEQGEAEADLNSAGSEDDQVLVDRHPAGHLRLELLPRNRKVSEADKSHAAAEDEAGGVP